MEKMLPTIIAMDRTALPAVDAIRPAPITQPGLNPLLIAHPAIISSTGKTAMKTTRPKATRRETKDFAKGEENV